MKCICLENLDGKPCPIHKDNPLESPPVVKHHTYVIHIYRRFADRKWFSTISKDAVRIEESPDFDSREEAAGCFLRTP